MSEGPNRKWIDVGAIPFGSFFASSNWEELLRILQHAASDALRKR
jgi:hypothetical protein